MAAAIVVEFLTPSKHSWNCRITTAARVRSVSPHNGWVIGTLIEKMDCDFSSSSAKVTDKGSDAKSSDSKSNDPAEVTDKSSDSKSNDPAEATDKSSDSKSNNPAEVTDDSSDSKDCPSSAGTSTESSNSNSSGNDAMSSNSSAKSSSSSVIVTNSSSSRNENSSSSETTLSCSSELSEASSSSESLSAGSIYDATANTLTDLRDGKTYKTVTIGRQIWMAENLNYAYTDVFYKRDNYTSDSTSWCYDNDPANCAKYGRLYTWAAAMDSLGKWSKNGKKLAPAQQAGVWNLDHGGGRQFHKWYSSQVYRWLEQSWQRHRRFRVLCVTCWCQERWALRTKGQLRILLEFK